MPRSGEPRSAGTFLQNFVREAFPSLTANPELGGVDIAVKPKGETKDLQSEKDRILQSRPSADQLSWPQKPQKPKEENP